MLFNRRLNSRNYVQPQEVEVSLGRLSGIDGGVEADLAELD